jgi:hypothetical protein
VSRKDFLPQKTSQISHSGGPWQGRPDKEVEEVRSIRNMALLALVAGLLLAIPASASASGGFSTGSYPASVHGSGGKLTLHTTGGSLVTECNAPVLDETISGPVHALSLAGTEDGACTAGGSAQMNGCELILHPGASPTAEIGPPGCGPMKVPFGCGSEIKPQTGIPLTYSGDHVADGFDILEGIEVSGNVSVGPIFCASTLKLTANWNLSTTNEAEQGLDLLASRDFVPVGVGLSDEKHPRTTAQAFPVNVAAVIQPPVDPSPVMLLEQIGSVKINTKCYGVNLSAGELTKESESAFFLSGTYWGHGNKYPEDYKEGTKCDSGLGTTTVSMNSCQYELPEVERTGPGTYIVIGGALACTKEGDGLTMKNSLCNITLPPQSLPMTLRNSGAEGMFAEIILEITTSSLKYTHSGGWGCNTLLKLPASGENGVMDQELFIRGTLPG